MHHNNICSQRQVLGGRSSGRCYLLATYADEDLSPEGEGYLPLMLFGPSSACAIFSLDVSGSILVRVISGVRRRRDRAGNRNIHESHPCISSYKSAPPVMHPWEPVLLKE